MAVYTPHTLVTFGGVLNAGAPDHEIWQCGVRVTAGGGGPLGDPGAYLIDVQGPLAAWFTDAGGTVELPASATLNWVKANNINAGGHYSDPVTHVHDYATPQAGGGTFTCMPDIMCLAVSWETAIAIRKHVYATHGRIYLPNYQQAGGVAAGSMRVPPATAAAWAAKGVDLLTLLRAGGGGTTVPVVASPHAGEIQPITGVRVGDVLDVQRRRKSALNEVYSGAVFP